MIKNYNKKIINNNEVNKYNHKNVERKKHAPWMKKNVGQKM